MKTGEENQLHNAHLQGILSSEVCNLVEKQVSALSDIRDSLSRVSESAETCFSTRVQTSVLNYLHSFLGSERTIPFFIQLNVLK